jgi:elongator complex protein 3
MIPASKMATIVNLRFKKSRTLRVSFSVSQTINLSPPRRMCRELSASLESATEDREKVACQVIAKKLQETEDARSVALDQREIWDLKLSVCAQFGLDRVPKNSEILSYLDQPHRLVFESRLRRKNVRTASGIAVITAITKPFNCPHGTCTFCPGGLRLGTPQSYTKNSPAVVFGAPREYDPRRQVSDTLSFLQQNGHNTSKVELILLGGTILAMPQDYQRDFVRQTYDALNGSQSLSLEEAVRANETAAHRCVGLTIETKPDWCKASHVDTLLSYGTTRVEIGVQSLRDDVLTAVNRGHTVKDSVDAFRVSKDAALKTVAHMMPGLPRSDPEKDLEDLLSLVNDEFYRPDMLKIYPTLVVEGTALYQQFKLGRYRPYNLDELVELLSKFKKQVPPWLRIMRIQREIPRKEVSGGESAGNLRQLVLDEMQRKGDRCRCIRCREIGHNRNAQRFGKLTLKRKEYDSSSGQEIFLSYDDEVSDVIHGFLRLRMPSGSEHREEIRDKRAALVRELHVYGPVVPVGRQTESADQSQHRGLGSSLLLEAERISREEFSRKKVVVISAVGTKEYYRKRGYFDDGPYVSKIT